MRSEYFIPFVEGCCVLLLSRSGAMKLSATVLRLSGLGFSGLVLFSKRVRASGSFTVDKEHTHKNMIATVRLLVFYKNICILDILFHMLYLWYLM